MQPIAEEPQGRNDGISLKKEEAQPQRGFYRLEKLEGGKAEDTSASASDTGISVTNDNATKEWPLEVMPGQSTQAIGKKNAVKLPHMGDAKKSGKFEQGWRVGGVRTTQETQKLHHKHGPPRIPQRKHPQSLPQQEGVVDRSQTNTITEMRQQLQLLFEQVKALQATLDAKTMPEKSASTPIGGSASQADSQSGEQLPKRKLPLLGRAWKRYRKSTFQLISVAKALKEISPRIAAPMESSILQRLRIIARDAIIDDDKGTRSILGGYAPTKSLVTGRGRLTVMGAPQPFPLAEKSQASKRYEPSLPVRPVIKAGANPKLRLVYSQSKDKASEAADSQTEATGLAARAPEVVREAAATNDTEAEAQKGGHNISEKKIDGQRLTRQIHTQSRLMKSSDHSNISTPAAETLAKPALNGTPKLAPIGVGGSEQSLLNELFPEASSPPQPRVSKKRAQYPKLELPNSIPIIRRELVDSPATLKAQAIESFRKKGEQTTVLQLSHCSTQLTEEDFRRLIPKGKHIESWHQKGDFYKIIPGRDPLSLERLPFYYILFKDAESALAYQKNASRLHKLSALHQPSSIFSAIPPPKGFLEDGEDLNRAISSYNLLPTHHQLSLTTLMQPYNPALRALIERGGYQPIVPEVNSEGKRLWKVLMHIEGYEPTPSDLMKIFRRDAYVHGMQPTLHNESSTSIHRLRDIINLKTTNKLVSSVRPRAYGSFAYEDPGIQSLMSGADEDSSPKEVNQMVMNRVYNRWVIDFSNEDDARRFALAWHRRVLPELTRERSGWKDMADVRMCNTEVLW